MQIKLKELALAVNRQIKEAFPSITITSKDISEGFIRPSFFVDFDSFQAERMSGRRTEKSIQIIIYYFPSDRYQYKLELLEVQEGLENAFLDGLLIDEETTLFTGELTSIVVDGVLQFEIKLDYVEIEFEDERTREDIPFVGELIYKG